MYKYSATKIINDTTMKCLYYGNIIGIKRSISSAVKGISSSSPCKLLPASHLDVTNGGDAFLGNVKELAEKVKGNTRNIHILVE